MKQIIAFLGAFFICWAMSCNNQAEYREGSKKDSVTFYQHCDTIPKKLITYIEKGAVVVDSNVTIIRCGSVSSQKPSEYFSVLSVKVTNGFGKDIDPKKVNWTSAE